MQGMQCRPIFHSPTHDGVTCQLPPLAPSMYLWERDPVTAGTLLHPHPPRRISTKIRGVAAHAKGSCPLQPPPAPGMAATFSHLGVVGAAGRRAPHGKKGHSLPLLTLHCPLLPLARHLGEHKVGVEPHARGHPHRHVGDEATYEGCNSGRQRGCSDDIVNG